jgi:hypothetical protein
MEFVMTMQLEEFRHEIRNIIRDEIDSFYKTRPDSIKNFGTVFLFLLISVVSSDFPELD